MFAEEVFAYFGSGYQVSKQMGFGSGTPYHWNRIGFIPIKTQMNIEKFTKGKLKANLLHCEPRIFPKVSK